MARQILLWGTAAALMAGSSTTILARAWLFGVGDETRLTFGVLLILAITVGAAVSTWWAFFPPRFLRGGEAAQRV